MKDVMDMRRSGGRIAFFDIDGTLIPGTSSAAHIAAKLGTTEAVVAAEAAYAAGDLTNAEVCRIDAQGWAGHHVEEVVTWLADLPLIGGIAETVDWCRRHGIAPYLATLAWRPVGEHLAARFGFAGVGGPELVVRDGVFTGEVARDFDEFDKRGVALGMAMQQRVLPRQCVAVGDSRSDLPLFAEVGCTIAFNASAEVKAIATHQVVSDDLRAIIPLLEAWLLR